MALTVSSPFFAELARKKAQQDLLRQQMVQASGQAMGAVDGFGKTQEAQKEQALRLKQQETENARAHTEQGLRLREFEERAEQNRINNERTATQDRIDNERNAALDAQNVEALRLKQGMAAREAMDARDAAAAKARADEEAAGRVEAERQAKLILAGVDNMEAEEGAAALDRVRALGFSDEEINEFRTQAMREQAARDLARRAAEAKIGQTERANRPKVGGGTRTGGGDPLADARLRKAQADAALAESKLNAKDAGGVKLSPSERKSIANTFETEAQVQNIVSLMEKAPPGVTQWAKVTAARATGLGEMIGEDIDPGGHGRAFYNAIEQFIIEERNRLMGASLTDNEKKAFERVAAALHQSPETARLALDNYLTVMRLRRESAIKSAELAASLERGTDRPVESEGAPGSADAEAAWGGDF